MADETAQGALEGLIGGADPMDGPIPGESLTANPEEQAPFEQAPQHTEEQPAIEEIFFRVTDPDTVDETLDLMRNGVPLEDIAQSMLFEGFRQGKFNPDMMLLLAEPTIYILAFLANYAGIDASLYPESTGEPEFAEEGDDDEFIANAPSELEGIQGEELPEQITVGEAVLARPESVPSTLLQAARGELPTQNEVDKEELEGEQ